MKENVKSGLKAVVWAAVILTVVFSCYYLNRPRESAPAEPKPTKDEVRSNWFEDYASNRHAMLRWGCTSDEPTIRCQSRLEKIIDSTIVLYGQVRDIYDEEGMPHVLFVHAGHDNNEVPMLANLIASPVLADTLAKWFWDGYDIPDGERVEREACAAVKLGAIDIHQMRVLFMEPYDDIYGLEIKTMLSLRGGLLDLVRVPDSLQGRRRRIEPILYSESRWERQYLNRKAQDALDYESYMETVRP